MKLKPYPVYKDSGVEWLRSVPGEWDVKPLKHVASVNDDVLSELTDPEDEIEYVDIGSVSVENGIEKTEIMKFSDAPSRARRRVRDGDVIVSTVRTYLKAIAPINSPPSNLVCSTGFAVLRPLLLNPVYAKYSMQTGYFIDEVIARSVGVSYPAINSSDMMCIRMTTPPLDEQSLIANFLDRETGKLDTLISKQQHLIELLQEKRQAIISHAVTKGLNPDAKMKDSGVEWLGMVPTSWKITKIKHIANLNPKVPDWVRSASDLTCNFLPMDKIGDDGTCTLDTEKAVDDVIAGYTYFENGDVCYAKVTPCFENGKGVVFSGLKNGIGFGTTEVTVFRPTELIRSDLLYFIFQSTYFKSVGEASMTGAGGLKRVSDSVADNLVIAIPSASEQVQLMDQLKLMIKAVDDLTDKAKRSIQLAKEHRTALISAAVTGKIDVREAA